MQGRGGGSSVSKAKGQSMSSQAYDRIRGDILSGQLQAGQKLIISDLVRDLGLNLGSVREALSRLSSEGLVESETNKGFRVTGITQEELDDLTRTRVLIECECLANSIANGNLEWETGIVSTLFVLSRLPLPAPEDPARTNPAWSAAHARFHQALVAACDSDWLLRIREMLFVQSERYRVATFPYHRVRRDLDKEHQAIADAAIARDIPAATAAMRDHLLRTRRILTEAKVAVPQG